MTEHVLVTGATGLIGTGVMQTLLAAGIRATGVSRNTSPSLDLSRPENIQRLLAELRPTVIVHGGAFTHVDRAESQRAEAWAVNVAATESLARFCQTEGSRFIFVSTDYVFDGQAGQYSEESPINPRGVYAVTKAAGELAAQAAAENHLIVRTSVPYGPWPLPKKDFVRWLRGELTERRRVRIVTDQISNPTWVPDFARMLLTLIQLHQEERGTLHLAGADSLSRFDFAMQIATALGLDASLIEPIATSDLRQAAPRPLNASLNVSRAKALGLEPLGVGEPLRELAAFG